MSPCYSLDARLVIAVGLASEMPKYSARWALRWQLRKIESEDSLYIQL